MSSNTFWSNTTSTSDDINYNNITLTASTTDNVWFPYYELSTWLPYHETKYLPTYHLLKSYGITKKISPHFPRVIRFLNFIKKYFGSDKV